MFRRQTPTQLIVKINGNSASIRQFSGCGAVKPKVFFHELNRFSHSVKAAGKLGEGEKERFTELLLADAKGLNAVYCNNQSTIDTYLQRKTGWLKTAAWGAAGDIIAIAGIAFGCLHFPKTFVDAALSLLRTPIVGEAVNFLSNTVVAWTYAASFFILKDASFSYPLSLAISILILLPIPAAIALGRHISVKIRKASDKRHLELMEKFAPKAPAQVQTD